jgi:hypothetical protein
MDAPRKCCATITQEKRLRKADAAFIALFQPIFVVAGAANDR